MKLGFKFEIYAKGNKELKIIVKSFSKDIERVLKQLVEKAEIKLKREKDHDV